MTNHQIIDYGGIGEDGDKWSDLNTHFEGRNSRIF